jgi:hypothetical protein
MSHDPGLAARPPARNNLEVGEISTLLFAFLLWTSPLRSDGAPEPSSTIPPSPHACAETSGPSICTYKSHL